MQHVTEITGVTEHTDRLNSADRSIAVSTNRLNRRHGCCGDRKDKPTDETRKRTDCSRTLARRLERDEERFRFFDAWQIVKDKI